MTQYRKSTTDIESRPGRPAGAEAGRAAAAEVRETAASEASGRPVAGKKRISRAKKRAKINRRVSLKMSLIFFAFMLLVALFLLVIPRSTVSAIEKRQLATWPTFSFANYFSGDFTSGITEFYDDTVPARDTFKNIGNNLKNLFGIKTTGNAEVIGNVSVRTTEATEAASDAETEPEGETASEEETTAEETTTADIKNSKDYRAADADATMEDGILVVYQDNHWRALALFGGSYDSLYCDVVNYVRSMISSSVNVYFMPVPLAAQFYLPANYKDYTSDEHAVFQEFMANMGDGVTNIDIVDVLNDHNAEPIYLRTDHHWSPLGAYYAAREFAKVAGVPFADLDSYVKMENEGYVGSMYAYTESANILNDPETFTYYIGTNKYVVDYYDEYFNYQWTGSLFFDVDVDNSYSSFLGSDDLIAKVTTDVNNGRKLLVIKDSYGNAQIPFYTSSFEEIYVIDQRYFEVNLINFINATGVTDVLFTHDSYSLVGAEAELLEYIAYYNTDVAIVDEAPAAEPTTPYFDDDEED